MDLNRFLLYMLENLGHVQHFSVAYLSPSVHMLKFHVLAIDTCSLEFSCHIPPVHLNEMKKKRQHCDELFFFPLIINISLSWTLGMHNSGQYTQYHSSFCKVTWYNAEMKRQHCRQNIAMEFNFKMLCDPKTTVTYPWTITTVNGPWLITMKKWPQKIFSVVVYSKILNDRTLIKNINLHMRCVKTCVYILGRICSKLEQPPASLLSRNTYYKTACIISMYRLIVHNACIVST